MCCTRRSNRSARSCSMTSTGEETTTVSCLSFAFSPLGEMIPVDWQCGMAAVPAAETSTRHVLNDRNSPLKCMCGEQRDQFG